MTQIREAKRYDLEERTFKFAKRIRDYVNKLTRTIANIEIGRQLIRAGCSVGANYIEANESLGKKDLAMRIKISRKESKETRYWIKLSEFRILTKITLFLLIVVSPVLTSAASLNDAYRDYLYGEFEEALSKAQKLRQDDQTLYFTGLTYSKLGDFARARAAFQKLLKRYPRSGFYERSLLKLADTYFLEGNYAQAKSLYKQMEDRNPAGNFVSLLYLRLAQIAGKQGEWAEKKKYLTLLKTNYSRCVEANFVDAIEGYGDSFWIQVGAFSNQDNALGLKKELEKKYQVDIVTDTAAGYTLYKVRVGSFEKRSQAEQVYCALLEQGYPARIYP